MENKKNFYKVVSFIPREDLEFLDNVIKDIYFSHGVKISRSKLIEEIIQNIKNKQDEQTRKALEEEFVKLFKNFKEKRKKAKPEA